MLKLIVHNLSTFFLNKTMEHIEAPFILLFIIGYLIEKLNFSIGLDNLILFGYI